MPAPAIQAAPLEEGRTPPNFKAHKTLPRRTVNGPSETHPEVPAAVIAGLQQLALRPKPSHPSAPTSWDQLPTTTPTLPPTPPSHPDPVTVEVVEADSQEQEQQQQPPALLVPVRTDRLLTPVNHRSPPTPDITPPTDRSRWSSSPGAAESVRSGSQRSPPPLRSTSRLQSLRTSSFQTAEEYQEEKRSIRDTPSLDGSSSLVPGPVHSPDMTPNSTRNEDRERSSPAQQREREERPQRDPHAKQPLQQSTAPSTSPGMKPRDTHLRERLQHHHHHHSPSIDASTAQFARDISWPMLLDTPPDGPRVPDAAAGDGGPFPLLFLDTLAAEVDRKRASYISATSDGSASTIVEARLVDDGVSNGLRKLRHVSKRAALREVNPPADKTVSRAPLSHPAEPLVPPPVPRLVHKRTRIPDRHRLSASSTASQVSPKRQKRSTEATTGGERGRPAKPTLQPTLQPPIPRRSSSLSAPTSRNVSRSTSLRSGHSHGPQQSHTGSTTGPGPNSHLTSAELVGQVGQATAVSIHPHQNTSLLLLDSALAGPGVSQEVAPQPAPAPQVELMAPTPVPIATSRPTRLNAVRRALSARRHSDTTTFAGLSSSLSRSLSQRSQRGKADRVDEGTQTRPSTRERPVLAPDDDRLSPFWRPRGFWDDLEPDVGVAGQTSISSPMGRVHSQRPDAKSGVWAWIRAWPHHPGHNLPPRERTPRRHSVSAGSEPWEKVSGRIPLSSDRRRRKMKESISAPVNGIHRV